MNIKKEVVERIKASLEKEYNKYKINNNLYEFKKLQLEQTILKRERARLRDLINGLK